MHYDYRCPCGHKFDDFRPVQERHHSTCPKCGARASLLFVPRAAQNHMKQFQPYVDPHISPDGEPVRIESRRQKDQMLRRQGLEPVMPSRWV